MRVYDDRLARKSNVTGAVPPSTEYFGFAVYVGATAVLTVFAIWAYAPPQWLEALGIHYYPSRWWALAVPAFILVAMGYTYVALALYNTEVLTHAPTSFETITDPNALVENDKTYFYLHRDAVCDLPLSETCKVLYGE